LRSLRSTVRKDRPIGKLKHIRKRRPGESQAPFLVLFVAFYARFPRDVIPDKCSASCMLIWNPVC